MCMYVYIIFVIIQGIDALHCRKPKPSLHHPPKMLRNFKSNEYGTSKTSICCSGNVKQDSQKYVLMSNIMKKYLLNWTIKSKERKKHDISTDLE